MCHTVKDRKKRRQERLHASHVCHSDKVGSVRDRAGSTKRKRATNWQSPAKPEQRPSETDDQLKRGPASSTQTVAPPDIIILTHSHNLEDLLLKNAHDQENASGCRETRRPPRHHKRSAAHPSAKPSIVEGAALICQNIKWKKDGPR